MTNVHERAAAANAALPQNLSDSSTPRLRLGGPASIAPVRADAIRRTGPQYWRPSVDLPPADGFGGGFSGMNGIISQLLGIVQQLLSMLGMGGMFGGFSGSAEQYFQSANGSSAGDPHLAFSGTAAGGSNQQTHFESMTSHGDLLDSDSFGGGYQVSTSVTAPGVNGVTFNERATVSTNFGDTQVSLDRSGAATISQNGQTISLANGQSLSLGNGETVTRGSDGSLVIRSDNGMGGSITTTLRDNGQGVDVAAQAQNVDLGGDLLNQPQQPIARPLPVRMPLEPA
ncbi:MAG TPA: hypothetical protein VJP85_03135 [Candidatus Baltobacteraceae bacterium]|nr:hypothetical protein [Candidatus Baltobacteraceae bacterium]